MSSIWDKNGRTHIPVTQEHIDSALAKSSSHCVIAESIRAACPSAKHIAVDLATIRWTTANGVRLVFLTPHLAREVIVHTDQAERDLIRPFVLRMKPAIVCHAGKKRRDHTPSNAELKEAAPGLRIGKKQLHLEDPHVRTQRVPDRSYPLDPDRSDGLAPPKRERDLAIAPADPPKRRPTRARAMVSTADRGSVPTVIGGRPPPVSILSRREFGLRVLRK